MAVKKGKGRKVDMQKAIDFTLTVLVEKKPDNGEDSAVLSAQRKDAAFFGVFDGCGGSGAKTCAKYFNKTEAYIASRITADAFHQWFEAGDPEKGWPVNDLRARLIQYLEEARDLAGEKSFLIGGIRKDFPTTAAAAICQPGDRTIEADLYWAGDSRLYLLDKDGLAQLTEDDLGGIDAMENLTSDGVLTNVINLSTDFTIHQAHVSLTQAGLIFAASDGCFGYYSTPMEFEYVLLETMLNSDSVSGGNKESEGKESKSWESKLTDRMGAVAGDDFTLYGLSFGYGSYENMKKAFYPRANELYNNFIKDIEQRTYEEKLAMWQSYSPNYNRLLCRPEPQVTD